MMNTKLCEILNIQYPIIQGGMAWVADAQLACAVSEAGGLGLIAAMNADADWVRGQIRRAKELTDKPFGVNIMLMSPFADDVARMVIEEKVAVITTGAGNPSKYMADWIAAGIKVIPVIPSATLAKRMEKNGACAVVAEGSESGGHIGELTTMALVPQVCDAVKIPVIAAGGIADGRGIAAALMLGASGVQVGTRFLSACECGIHATYKQKVLAAGDTDTIVTGRRLGHPVRALKTAFTREFAKLERQESVSDEQLERFGSGALRMAAQEGNLEKGCFIAGQIAGLVKREQPAAEIVAEMFSQAEEILKGACQWVR